MCIFLYLNTQKIIEIDIAQIIYIYHTEKRKTQCADNEKSKITKN